MVGYFHTNNLCMACSNITSGCLTCAYDDGASGTLLYNSSKFTCTLCNNTLNYFINGKLCTLCTLSNCQNCLNLTACKTCTSSYKQSITLTCVKCNVIGCGYCSATNSNICAECNNTLGYYIQGSACIAKCGDGIIVGPS